MTNYLKEFEEALEDYLNMTIYFNDDDVRYKFQGFWTSSNFKKEIQQKTKELRHLLSRQLKNGLDNRVFLSEVKLKLQETHNFLYDVYFDEFDDLSKSNLKIRKSFGIPISFTGYLYL